MYVTLHTICTRWLSGTASNHMLRGKKQLVRFPACCCCCMSSPISPVTLHCQQKAAKAKNTLERTAKYIIYATELLSGSTWLLFYFQVRFLKFLQTINIRFLFWYNSLGKTQLHNPGLSVKSLSTNIFKPQSSFLH